MMIILVLPLTVWPQLVIDSLDDYQESGSYRIIPGTEGSYLTISTSRDTVAEGAGSFRIAWHVQAKSILGGMTRVEVWHPDSAGVWDLSSCSTLHLSYFNAVASSRSGYIRFLIYFYEVSDAPADADAASAVEIWQLTNDILDVAPGWNQLELPLRIKDIGAPEQTPWLQSQTGIPGNRYLDLDKVRGFAFVFSGSGRLYSTDTKASDGVLFLDDFSTTGSAAGDLKNAVHIVVLGSSTAEGTGTSNINNSWVNRYRSYLKSVNANHRVDNLAKGGYTTFHLLPTGQSTPSNRPKPDSQRNITQALSLNPDAIIINLPSNDATSGYSVQEQLANYDSMLAAANRQHVPVWITTTQPRNLSESGRQNLKEMRDSTFARFAAKAVDFWTGLAQESGIIVAQYNSGDGVHLNDAAHELLFNRVAEKNLPAAVVNRIRTHEIHPQSLRLFPNYPNPFNSSTTVEFQLPSDRSVELAVYNLLGQKMASRNYNNLAAGRHKILLDARGWASGVYLYQIRMGEEVERGKMTLLQ
jgi:lysophospholipase L1-like esterase